MPAHRTLIILFEIKLLEHPHAQPDAPRPRGFAHALGLGVSSKRNVGKRAKNRLGHGVPGTWSDLPPPPPPPGCQGKEALRELTSERGGGSAPRLGG